MTYSTDFRRLAFIKFQRSGRLRATAREMEVSPSTLHRWKVKAWWGAARTQGRRRRSRVWTPDVNDLVVDTCRANACTTVRRLQATVEGAIGRRVSQTTIRRGLRRAGFSRRRLSSKVLGSALDDQIAQFRERFHRLVSPTTMIVSVDESHFSDRVLPQYGYCLRGQKAARQRTARGGGWTSYSLLHAIASDGRHHSTVVKGSVTRETFTQFVTSMPFARGAVLLLDNCSIHKRIDAVLAEKGYHALYLSPYSPEFQPVEMAFSAIKAAFRRGWPWQCTIPEMIMSAISTVSPTANQHFIQHALRIIASGAR